MAERQNQLACRDTETIHAGITINGRVYLEFPETKAEFTADQARALAHTLMRMAKEAEGIITIEVGL